MPNSLIRKAFARFRRPRRAERRAELALPADLVAELHEAARALVGLAAGAAAAGVADPGLRAALPRACREVSDRLDQIAFHTMGGGAP